MPLLTLPLSPRPLPPGRAQALVFEDRKSRALLERLEQVAPSDATVLIVGETGTGKEIVARHIHQLSHRAGRSFVAVNCGALSESLIESELFGHDRGAFTGAVGQRAGWFEAAEGGTLFLDEIGDLPLGAQVKLLRVLQEREVVRLGSLQAVPVDVRLIAATNVNIEEAVVAGTFRQDLFYRLAVARVSVDPLRERADDILPLARHFATVYAARLGRRRQTGGPLLTPEAEQRLLLHGWPGNIRELENAIHHAVLVSGDGPIAPDDLLLISLPPRREAVRETSVPETQRANPVAPAAPRQMLRQALDGLFREGRPHLWNEIEKTVISTAHEHARHNQLKTARLLGLGRSVVRARLLRFGILPKGSVPAND